MGDAACDFRGIENPTSIDFRSFNGFGVSVIDSLDTMALMGLKEEFQRGLSHAAKLNMSQSVSSSYNLILSLKMSI